MNMKKSKRREKIRVIIIGPTPPPFHGVSVFIKNLLNSNVKNKFDIFHLDTADRRTVPNIGKLDFQNVYLAIKHIFILTIKLITYKPNIVYIPISQNRLGYLRDGLFIILSRILGGKVIIHLHGGIFNDFYKKTDKITKIFIKISLNQVHRACRSL